MEYCILFILWTGTGHATPDCYVDGVYVTPHDVVYVSQVPDPYWRFTHRAPPAYTAYYLDYARTVETRRYSYVHTSWLPRWHYGYRWRTYRQYRSYRWGFWRPHKRPHAQRRVGPRYHKKYKKYKKYTRVKYKRRAPVKYKYKQRAVTPKKSNKRSYKKRNYRRKKR